MKMVGHKTEAMYRRYAIADESMLREGAAKTLAAPGADGTAVPGTPFGGVCLPEETPDLLWVAEDAAKLTSRIRLLTLDVRLASPSPAASADAPSAS